MVPNWRSTPDRPDHPDQMSVFLGKCHVSGLDGYPDHSRIDPDQAADTLTNAPNRPFSHARLQMIAFEALIDAAIGAVRLVAV